MRRPLRPTRRTAAKPADILVVAHRGDSLSRPEHTIDAYVAAIASGADGLECDVRLSRDGHLVCVHDRRVNRTSNGTGIVSELDLAGLNALDFSSWREEGQDSADQLIAEQADGDAYLAGVAPFRDAAGGVLTLEALLGLVADAGRPLRLLVETKHPTRYAGLVEKELVRTLHHFGYGAAARSRASARQAGGSQAGASQVGASQVGASQVAAVARANAGADLPANGSVAVMSFAAIALRRTRLLDPELPTVLLQERLLPGRRDGRLPSGTDITGIGLAALRRDPDYVARARRRGHQVYVWTVDDASDIEFGLDLGVDAIITNDPRLARELRDNQF